MKERRRVILTKAAEECGLSPDLMLRFISLSWVSPEDPEQSLLDEEDISRARLIAELQRDFGINDEAIPVILQLLDQLHLLHSELTRR
ncbi:MAG: chaperone modulator CbpM [Bdellovibrionota bacterium]